MNQKTLQHSCVGLVLILLGGCNAPKTTSKPFLPTATPLAPTTTPLAPTATPAPLPDLTQRPQIWFNPLPPMTVDAGRPFTGSDDFMDLFTDEAGWQVAAERVHVFELFGEWVAWNASDEELRQVVTDLNRRGIAIAFAGGPLNASAACGGGIEGFAGREEGLRIATRIRDARGTVSFVVFDEPFAFASIYDGPNACHWTAEKVAEEVYKYVQLVRSVFPNAMFGTDEPLWTGLDPHEIENWLEVYEAVNGEPLSFLHLDVDWGRSDWPQVARQLEVFSQERGVEFGIFYLGNWSDYTDESWLSSAGERVKEYELVVGGRPDHVVFASWHDHPDRVLPETQPYSFTWFINTCVEDKSSLGFRREGPGVNLAFDKPVRFSSDIPGFIGELAVDGNPETWWGAGAPPPQWIEIDLGAGYDIAELLLWISQAPAGETTHHMYGKGPGTDNEFVLLHTFIGFTDDFDLLTYAPPDSWRGLQFIRIETVSSPSWVSWREIEVTASK